MKSKLFKTWRVIAAMCAFCVVSGQNYAEPKNAHFIGTGNTDWNLPANWAEGIVPANNGSDRFNVFVDQSGLVDYSQINIHSSLEVSRLDLHGNLFLAVATPAELRILDFFQFRGGTLLGNGGVYHLVGDAEFSGPTVKYLATSTLHMYGLTRWTGGNLDFSLYSSVQNHAGAVFSIETSGYFGSPVNTSSASVRNDGILRVNAPGMITRWHSELTNSSSGEIQLQAGQLVLQGRFTGEGGAMRVAQNASFVSRFFASFEGIQVENAGVIRLEGPTHVASDTFLPGKVILANNLTGPGAVTIGQMEWRGGILDGPGALFIPIGASLETLGTGLLHYNRPLLNQGTFSIHQDSGSKTFLPATNDSSGTIILEGGTQWGSGALLNRGRIVKDVSGGGAELLIPAITNTGSIRVHGGTLRIQGPVYGGEVEIAEGGRLVLQSPSQGFHARGSGSLHLVGENQCHVEPDLELISVNTTLSGAASYLVRSLEFAGGFAMSPEGEIEARQQFRFTRGALTQARVHSVGAATFAFSGAASIHSGGALDLQGASRWLRGNLDVGGSGALRNSGEMRFTAPAQLSVSGDGFFENSGILTVMNSATGAVLNIRPNFTALQIIGSASSSPLAPSPYGARGKILLTTNGLVASSSELRVSSFLVANSTLDLSNSLASATVAANLTNTLVWLRKGEFVPPSSGLVGSPLFQGFGIISGSIVASAVSLLPDTENSIEVHGDLSAKGLSVSMALASGTVSAPHLRVEGSVSLSGRLDFALRTDSTLFNLIPTVTLLESRSPLVVTFSNVKSGYLISTADGAYQAKVYFGPDSPFGPNKLVLAEIGSAFDRWRASKFNADQLNQPTISGADADPDNNGFGNLAEYVFGIEGISGAPSINPLHQGGYTLFSVQVRKGTDQFNPRLSISSDLSIWTEFAPGSEAGVIRLLRTFETNDLKIYWYSYPAIPTSLYLRSTVVIP